MNPACPTCVHMKKDEAWAQTNRVSCIWSFIQYRSTSYVSAVPRKFSNFMMIYECWSNKTESLRYIVPDLGILESRKSLCLHCWECRSAFTDPQRVRCAGQIIGLMKEELAVRNLSTYMWSGWATRPECDTLSSNLSLGIHLHMSCVLQALE